MNATTDVERREDEVDDGTGEDGRQDKDGSRSLRVVSDPGDDEEGDRVDNNGVDTDNGDDNAVEVLVVTTVCLSFMTRFIRIRPIKSDLKRRYETGKKRLFLLSFATKLRPWSWSSSSSSLAGRLTGRGLHPGKTTEHHTPHHRAVRDTQDKQDTHEDTHTLPLRCRATPDEVIC
jgi:hypothetical protein